MASNKSEAALVFLGMGLSHLLLEALLYLLIEGMSFDLMKHHNQLLWQNYQTAIQAHRLMGEWGEMETGGLHLRKDHRSALHCLALAGVIETLEGRLTELRDETSPIPLLHLLHV